MNTNGPDLNAAPPAPGEPAVAPVGGFNITGYTYSHDGVARLLARLAVIPHLANVKLGSSVLDTGGTRPTVKFAITASLRTPGATS
jgi:hypothetical protein